jgi:uncharacterized membrane protein
MRAVLLLTVTSVVTVSAGPGGAPARYEVLAFKNDGLNVVAVNARGDVVGFESVERKERPGIVEEAPFFARGKEVTYLPTLKGYTATFPAAVSDDGLVVGRASKPGSPGRRVMLRNQAFVWDARGGIRGLGALEGDFASFATGVTRDGRRISGYTLGENRLRPCVWDRDGERWTGTALPSGAKLTSHTVPISDDGKYVAAVDAAEPCLWTRDGSGTWTREVIGEAGSLYPRAVNNSGTVVGLRHTLTGATHAVVWTRKGGVRLMAKPKGYVRSEANAVNNLGVAVGMADGPPGGKLGPNAVVFEGETVRVVTEGGPNFAAANAINDRGQVAGIMEVPEEPEAPAARGGR